MADDEMKAELERLRAENWCRGLLPRGLEQPLHWADAGPARVDDPPPFVHEHLYVFRKPEAGEGLSEYRHSVKWW